MNEESENAESVHASAATIASPQSPSNIRYVVMALLCVLAFNFF